MGSLLGAGAVQHRLRSLLLSLALALFFASLALVLRLLFLFWLRVFVAEMHQEVEIAIWRDETTARGVVLWDDVNEFAIVRSAVG